MLRIGLSLIEDTCKKLKKNIKIFYIYNISKLNQEFKRNLKILICPKCTIFMKLLRYLKDFLVKIFFFQKKVMRRFINFIYLLA